MFNNAKFPLKLIYDEWRVKIRLYIKCVWEKWFFYDQIQFGHEINYNLKEFQDI